MIERNQIIEIARKRAEENGWEFAWPFDMFIFPKRWWGFGLSHFEIWTNAGYPGTKARFVIDAKTEKILSEEYMPQITSEHRQQPEMSEFPSEWEIPLIRICSVRFDSCCQSTPEQDQALEIAHKRAEEKNWVFVWPVNVSIHRSWSGKPRRFEIMTNADGLGAKAHFVIDAKTGKILYQWYVPR